MCNIDQDEVHGTEAYDFHLLQTSRFGWEITLPRESDTIRIIINQHGIALYRDLNTGEPEIVPVNGQNRVQGEFLERWILI
jgi:hypothetical protein